MNPVLTAILVSTGLVLGLMVCIEIGLRIGRHDARRNKEFDSGTGAIEAAVFGLIGLLMAFMFSGSASRLDARRTMIVDEANAIGTAYLRLDLLAPADRDLLRQSMRSYVDTRMRVYANLRDEQSTLAEWNSANTQQGVIWSQAVEAVRRPDASPQAAMLLIPALNEMFDISTSRTFAGKTHVATVLVVLLCGSVMLGGLLAGYGMAKRGSRSIVHLFVFALVLGMTVYVIMDLEFPRFGLINLLQTDEALIQVRNSMK